MCAVTLREITQENEADIRGLAVAPGQELFVDSVSQSLDEAKVSPQANPWFRAVYVNDQPVGFVMVSFDVPPGLPDYPWRYFLWRLLIDARHQRQGYGRAAMKLVVEIIRGSPGGTELFSSVHPGEGGPSPFYRSLGFEPTGEWLEGEEIIRLSLDRAT